MASITNTYECLELLHRLQSLCVIESVGGAASLILFTTFIAKHESNER